MVNVKAATFCPNCHLEVQVLAVRCRFCGKILKPAPNAYFQPPSYFSAQFEALRRKLEDDEPGEFTEDHPKSLKARAQYEQACASFVPWIRQLPTADKLGALVDAQLVTANLIHSNLDREDLEKVLALASNIGRIAENLRNLLKSGCSIEPETRDVFREQDNVSRSATSTAGSGDTV